MKKYQLVLFLMFCLITKSQAAMNACEIEKLFCEGDCEQKLVVEHQENDVLNHVEHFVIQTYTESYRIIDQDYFQNAVTKIPKSVGVFYRGTQKKSTKINRLGQVVNLSRITSISGDRYTAEGFVKDQLLIIKANSAHRISKYSVLGEDELILLPGTTLKVDEIRIEKIDLSSEGESNIIDVEVVELSEI